MKPLENFKELVRKAKEIDLETLVYLRYGVIVFIFAIIFGFYWYLKLKSIAMSLLLVCMFALVVILLLERRKGNKKGEKVRGNHQENSKLNSDDKPDLPKEPPKPWGDLKIDLSIPGMPSSKEYNNNLSRAIGNF